MKNKAPVVDQHSQIRAQDWIFWETQDDDFLMGKTAKDLGDTWEEDG